MKPIILVLTLLVSCFAGPDRNQDSTELRTAGKVEGFNVAGLTGSFTPTPTNRLSNAERLRRSLPSSTKEVRSLGAAYLVCGLCVGH